MAHEGHSIFDNFVESLTSVRSSFYCYDIYMDIQIKL